MMPYLLLTLAAMFRGGNYVVGHILVKEANPIVIALGAYSCAADGGLVLFPSWRLICFRTAVLLKLVPPEEKSIPILFHCLAAFLVSCFWEPHLNHSALSVPGSSWSGSGCAQKRWLSRHLRQRFQNK